MLCWNLLQVHAQVSAGGCDDIFCDGDEALELLQKRGVKSFVQQAIPQVEAIGQALQATRNETCREIFTQLYLGFENLVPSPWRAAAVVGLLPSLVAVGLPLLANRGLIEAAAVAAFWLVIRPASAMLEASWWFLVPGPKVSAQRMTLGLIPEAMVTAAHFYWCWGLFELVGRRRPALQRLLAVLFLTVVLLPVTLAQVFLEHLQPRQACICALLGDSLGLLFFLALRTPPCWRLITAMPRDQAYMWSKVPTFQLHDNLSTFWGGCVWSSVSLQQPVKSLKGEALRFNDKLVDQASYAAGGERLVLPPHALQACRL